MAYTSFRGRRVLGARYSVAPEVALEEKRMEQQYAMMPERARLAESKRQFAISLAEREEMRKERERAAMMATGGNVAGMGLQTLKVGKDMGWWGPQKTADPSIPTYDKSNPLPTAYSQTSPFWGRQAPPLNTPTGMYGDIDKASYVDPSVNPSNVDTGGFSGVNTAIGAGSTALGALKTYDDFERGDYVNGVFDATKTGIGMYQTANAINAGLNASQAAGQAAGAGAQAGAQAGTQAAGAVGSVAGAAGSVLPVVSAAIGAGQGVADVAKAKTAQEAVSGVWRIVDGVLQYVVPMYGAGRAASGLVDAIVGLAGEGNSPIINNIQNIFDPAGMAAGQRKGESEWTNFIGKG